MIFARLNIFQRGLILVGLPLLIELGILSGLAVLLYESDREQLKESIYRRLAGINARLIILATQTPYYLVHSVTYQSDKLFAVYEEKQRELRKCQKELALVLAKTPEFSDGIKELDESIDKLANLNDSLAENRKGHLTELVSKLSSIVANFNSQKAVATERLAKMLSAGEMRTAEMQRKQALIRSRQSQILWLGLALNMAAALLLARFYRSGISLRLRTIQQNTLDLASGKELAALLTGDDEIAQLDKAFHAMDSQLKAAAEREKELFDNAADVICVLDSQRRFLKVNKASRRIWGYDPEQLVGAELDGLIFEEDLEETKEAFVNAELSGEPVVFENRIINAEKGELDLSWSSYWSRLDGRLYCVAHDISKRKQVERMKQRFLSMISSDLKRPLSSMAASIAFLVGSAQEELSETAMERLKLAGKNLQRLLGLVNDLLQVAQMDAAEVEISKELCDLDELLMRSAQEVEVVAEKHGVRVSVEPCQIQVLLDPNRIVQVLVNLLSNAIKFSPKDSEVTLAAFERSDDLIEVQVKDRGRGVPDSHKEAIFEKFKQVEAADGKRKAGTGLGLPICKQIVEDHEGLIGVESVSGQGSTFWFRLPKDDASCQRLKSQRLEGQLANKDLSSAASAQHPASSISSLTPLVKRTSVFGRLKLSYKGAILVGLPLLFELLLVGAITVVLQQSDYERKQELYHRKISFQTSKLMNMYFVMSLGAVGSNSVSDWDVFHSGYMTVRKTLDEIEALLRRDPSIYKQILLVRQEDEKVAEWVRLGEEVIAARGLNLKSVKEATGGKERMLPTLIKIVRRLEKIVDHSEAKESTSPERQKSLRSKQAQILGIALALNVISALALAAFFARDIVSRLQVLADNAMRLAREARLNAPLWGSDEIAELDRTFHATALALHEARKKERAVFDNSQDIICSVTCSGEFRTINAAAAKLWGYERKELLGKRLQDIVYQDDHAQLEGKMLKLAPGMHEEQELRIRKSDSSIMHMQWSYSRTTSEGDVLCVAHDISNLVELAKLKKEFLAMVSHDLRTPLTAVIGVAKLVQIGAFGSPGERTRRRLDQLLKSGDQLLELINDLLDIEKLEAGKMQLVIEDTKLRDLVDRAVAGARDKRRVRLKVDGAARDIVIKVDKDRMAQAIGNVLNSSLDRCPEKSSIEVWFLNKNNALEILVKDNSRLLSQEEFDALFERIQAGPAGNALAGAVPAGSVPAGSVPAGSVPAGSVLPGAVSAENVPAVQEEKLGTGLSMPIAKKIIEGHGGSIKGYSGSGENTICISIPLLVRESASAAE